MSRRSRCSRARRRVPAWSTDRAGARRRSPWASGGRERRSVGRPEAGKRPRRPGRRDEAAGAAMRAPPRGGRQARAAQRAADPSRPASPARQHSLLQKNCLTPGSLRSRLIASKLGFEPVEMKENQPCSRPLTDFAPMTAIPKACGGSRSTGAFPRRSSRAANRLAPGAAAANSRAASPKSPDGGRSGLRRFSFACNPLKNLNRRKKKFQNISAAPGTPGRRGGTPAPARSWRRLPCKPSP